MRSYSRYEFCQSCARCVEAGRPGDQICMEERRNLIFSFLKFS